MALFQFQPAMMVYTQKKTSTRHPIDQLVVDLLLDQVVIQDLGVGVDLAGATRGRRS